MTEDSADPEREALCGQRGPGLREPISGEPPRCTVWTLIRNQSRKARLANINHGQWSPHKRTGRLLLWTGDWRGREAGRKPAGGSGIEDDPADDLAEQRRPAALSQALRCGEHTS